MMIVVRQSIFVLCFMAVTVTHPQSALPTGGAVSTDFQRFSTAVAEAIRQMEEDLAPLEQEIQEVERRLNLHRAELARCRQDLEMHATRIAFVSGRIEGHLESNAVTIGNESYSKAEINRAVGEQESGIARQARRCDESSIAIQSSRAEVDAKKAGYDQLREKLEAFKQKEVELTTRWAQMQKQSRFQELERALSAGDSLILASDSELGRALFHLESLVSGMEADLVEIDRFRNLDLTQSTLK